MENAAIVAVTLFGVGVVYWSGWMARVVAEHERRITGLEESHAAILTAINELHSELLKRQP